jgi:hypothetical protein
MTTRRGKQIARQEETDAGRQRQAAAAQARAAGLVKGESGEIPLGAGGDVQRQRGLPPKRRPDDRRLPPAQEKDASFRAGWLDAIAVGYSKLEMILLDRAFNGTEKIVTKKDGSEERMLEYPNHIGLQLLKMHRDTAIEADAEMAPDDIDEIRERLVRKLQRLKVRDEAQESGSLELRGDIAPRDGDAESGEGRAPA